MTGLGGAGAAAGGRHEEWLAQIEGELRGELTLAQRAALARHLAGCPACAGARVSRLDLEVSFARAAGEPHAVVHLRPTLRGRTLALWVAAALIAGAVGGWLIHWRWGRPGAGGSLEDARATILVR
jgi:putative zinc finger protein